MSDYGGQKDGEEKEEDDDDLLKTLESEQQASLPNDEEWDLSDSEFFNFFIQPGFDSSSSPPLDNQPLINYREPRDHNLPLQGFPKGNDDTAQDDPISKKRRRQERNRDAALRSREKKKLYVRELEMKSRYFEGECKRLGMLLNCVSAENHALRLSLQSSKAFDVSRTKQESAVLFLGMNLQKIPAVGFPALVPGSHVSPQSAKASSINKKTSVEKHGQPKRGKSSTKKDRK